MEKGSKLEAIKPTPLKRGSIIFLAFISCTAFYIIHYNLDTLITFHFYSLILFIIIPLARIIKEIRIDRSDNALEIYENGLSGTIIKHRTEKSFIPWRDIERFEERHHPNSGTRKTIVLIPYDYSKYWKSLPARRKLHFINDKLLYRTHLNIGSTVEMRIENDQTLLDKLQHYLKKYKTTND